MSRRREILRHLDALGDMRSIVGAMRTLALVEIGRLGRFSAAQREMVATIERAAGDFFAFAPPRVSAVGAPRGVVAFGSERGFCGGFNEAIAGAIAEARGPLVVVGHRLAERVSVPPVRVIEGATTADEVRAVVARLAADLAGFDCAFELVHHDPVTVGIRRVDPLRVLGSARAPLGGHPPRHYLDADALAAALVEHYLVAALLDVAYASFLAENRERLRHMEGAIDHLDRELAHGRKRLNARRQEDITEEIAVLLLGSTLATCETPIRP